MKNKDAENQKDPANGGQMQPGVMFCNCGGNKEKDHNIGEEGCFREWAIPPRKISCSDDMWMVTEVVNGKQYKSKCTGYALRHQRMYSEHEDGRWSRPKGGVSVNSLPDET